MLISWKNRLDLAALCAALLLLLPAGLAHGAAGLPELSGRVVDQAGLLSESQEAALVRQLGLHESETTNQVIVVTLVSLHDEEIAEVGRRLGNHWGLGQKGRDNGVLLLIAPEERQVRIAVGQGLEGLLDDETAHGIIQNEILPAFKRGDYAAGIEQGSRAIIATLEGSYEASRASIKDNESLLVLSIIGAIFAVVVILVSALPRPGPDGIPLDDEEPDDSRGNSSGGYSGGGGSFGGGGATGHW